VAIQHPGVDAKAQPAANTAAVQKRMDAVAEALVMLGEETRRIAIASALQASGGPEADNIKVADELKVLATRFNTVARHWSETAPVVKEMIAGSSHAAASNESPAAAQAANRARLWGERAVAMNEHVRALERAIGVAPSSRPAPAEFTSSAVDLDSPAAATPAAVTAPAHKGDEELVSRSGAEMFGNDNNADISFADIPAFEKEHRFFADPPADLADSDERFVVDNSQERRWDLSEEKSEEESGAAPAHAEAKPASDSDGFLTGPRPTVKSPRAAAPVTPRAAAPPPQPAPAPAPQPAQIEETAAVATATLDPDLDAVDLYALGAIDCVQTA
jgi:hypothetical protein